MIYSSWFGLWGKCGLYPFLLLWLHFIVFSYICFAWTKLPPLLCYNVISELCLFFATAFKLYNIYLFLRVLLGYISIDLEPSFCSFELDLYLFESVLSLKCEANYWLLLYGYMVSSSKGFFLLFLGYSVLSGEILIDLLIENTPLLSFSSGGFFGESYLRSD